MTVREALKEVRGRLTAAGVPDAKYDAAQLVSAVTGKDALSLALCGTDPLTETEVLRLRELAARREAREPLQYILGTAPFAGLEFAVRPGVLIPRFDTETVLEEALARAEEGASVLDIGTGPGTLAVSMAKLGKHLKVSAADISPAALAIARENAERLEAEVEFRESDCFSAFEGRRFDMIISNPPYISSAEMEELMPEVRQEPELALFGGTDGLDFYRRICAEAPEHLNPRGWLIFEIGWQQKNAVCTLLEKYIGEPFAKKDLGDNWRAVGAQLR